MNTTSRKIFFTIFTSAITHVDEKQTSVVVDFARTAHTSLCTQLWFFGWLRLFYLWWHQQNHLAPEFCKVQKKRMLRENSFEYYMRACAVSCWVKITDQAVFQIAIRANGKPTNDKIIAGLKINSLLAVTIAGLWNMPSAVTRSCVIGHTMWTLPSHVQIFFLSSATQASLCVPIGGTVTWHFVKWAQPSPGKVHSYLYWR